MGKWNRGLTEDDITVDAPPKDRPKRLGHVNSCQTNLGAMSYDDTCLLCKMISKVIMLRRKRVELGCSEQEAMAASAMATKIVEQYRIKKGDVFDRQYDAVAIVQRVAAQKTYHDTYGAANVRNQPWNKTAKMTGGKKINDYFRKPEFMSEY